MEPVEDGSLREKSILPGNNNNIISKNIEKNVKIFLALMWKLCYTNSCCDMIAMKREVATIRWVFRGANVKRPKISNFGRET